MEPSLDSLEVAERVFELSHGLQIGDVWAVLNKVPSEEVATTLATKLSTRNIPLIGAIHYDPAIFKACLEGSPLHGGISAGDMEKVLDFIFP